MAKVNPYLHFNGNCEEAFNFYKSIFGRDFSSIQRFKDAPPEQPFPENESEKILHIALPLGKKSSILGSDIPDAFPKAIIGTNFFISLDSKTEEEATRIFNELATDGQVYMPLGKTFWAALFGMLVDKFGIQWMVSFN